MNTLQPISQTGKIEVPFVKAILGGVEFGLTSKRNSITGVRYSDFIKSLTVEKYGSGAVNTYTMIMKYVIGDKDDPNFVDKVISNAQDRKIYFTYGDISQPNYSYKNEEAIISNILPVIDYKSNSITYTIKATSSTKLNYTIKRTFEATKAQPSQEILRVLYNPEFGLLDLLPGMRDKEKVLQRKWIPTGDKVVEISEKVDISPLDYILYLVSLMVGETGAYYFLKIIDTRDGEYLPHFEIISTDKKQKSQMLTIKIGYPGSIPVHNFEVSQDSSVALMVEYRDQLENGIVRDYSFRGDLIQQKYYSIETVNGKPSENLKNWWNKMKSFPITATLTTDGLHVPAEIIQSVYLDVIVFGKKYWHSGEYLIMSQTDSISESGYRTSLGLMRIGG